MVFDFGSKKFQQFSSRFWYGAFSIGTQGVSIEGILESWNGIDPPGRTPDHREADGP